MKKISIITPCLNSEKYIAETVGSIINQSALQLHKIELEYIIVDGQSCDRTLDIVREMTAGFRYGKIKIISEKDQGMYDALAKGINQASGDIFGYLNAGDIYSLQAFDILLDIFNSKKTKWLTGYGISYNEASAIVDFSLPFKYRKRFFECGYYGHKLAFVQQESTFWDCELNSNIDLSVLSKFRLAGDYYLWHQFSQKCELNIVAAYLGGFKHHRGQLSENIKQYFEEMKLITKKPSIIDWVMALNDRLIWHCPLRTKKALNYNNLFVFDYTTEQWV